MSCIVSRLHFVYGAAINRRSSVMHRAPFSAWQGVMVPHVMWCAGHGPRATDGAASRPCSIDGGCLAALFDQCRSLAGLCGRERCLQHCGRNLFLKIQETRHAAVCVSFGSLMVHRQQWDTSWGAKKFNFLIRDIDDATRAGASMESSQYPGPEVSRRSPRVDKVHVQSPTPHARALRSVDANQDRSPAALRSRAPWRAPSTAACGVSDYPTPDLSRRESRSRSTSEKSK